MGFLDRFKSTSSELRHKAEETIAANTDKIDAGLDKAADAARKATKGKYDDKIDQVTGKAKEGVEKLGDDKSGDGAGPAT